MYSIRVFALFALANLYQRALGVPQAATITEGPGVLVTPLADLNGPAALSASASVVCGGCRIVADVAALVWYSEAFINTAATAYVGVYGGNGTQVTRTSVVQNEAPFTYDPDAMSSAGFQNLVLTPVDYAPTATISGATFTSPTAYNVFSSYTLTSGYLSDNQCQTTTYVSSLDTPYSEILPSASGQVALDAAGQQDFINHIGFTTCSGGGERAQGSALVPVVNVTSSVTSTFSSVPLGNSISLAPTTNPTATASPGGIVTLTEIFSSTTVTATLTGTAYPSGSASIPDIVVGSTTITPTARPLSLPVLNGSITGSILTAPIVGNTTIIGSTQIIGTATGTGVGGGGNSTGIVPFISEASDWKSRNVLGVFVATILVALMLL